MDDVLVEEVLERSLGLFRAPEELGLRAGRHGRGILRGLLLEELIDVNDLGFRHLLCLLLNGRS